MRFLASALLLLAALLTGCATTVVESKKVNNLLAPPESVTFIWSSAKEPKTSHLPALGGRLLLAPPAETFWKAYPGEYLAFAETLRPLLAAQASLRPELVVLPAGHAQGQLDAVLQQVRKRSAVVLMYPEAVTSYCDPGCYAFKVRVNYLSAAQRKLVWTGLVDLRPKNNHHDSFEPIAREFTGIVLRQLAGQQLLPR